MTRPCSTELVLDSLHDSCDVKGYHLSNPGDAKACCTQSTSQNFSVGSQIITNYRRTAECSQNRQTFVNFGRTKFY